MGGRGWARSALSRAVLITASIVSAAMVWVACRAPGLNNGASCGRATECESLVCSFQLAQDAGPDGRAMGTCVGRCTTSAACGSGQVCGRYDFRGIIPDSGGPDAEGVREGPDFEVLRACRSRNTRACTRDDECSAGQGCLGAPMGVCGARCTRSSQCSTGICQTAGGPEACNEPGVCVAECDDGLECQAGSYCQFAVSNSIHGRCALIVPPDASVCVAPEAGPDATPDAAQEPRPDVVQDAVADAAAMDASSAD